MLASFAKQASHTSFKVLVVGFCLITSWEIVYVTGGTRDAFPYVFFLPITLSAWYWSLRASAIVALVAGIMCGPLMYLNTWTNLAQPWPNILARILIFIGFGGGIGYLLDHLKAQHYQLQQAGTELIRTLAHTIELRDPYTNGHCERVSKMAVQIGRELGLSSKKLLYLEWAALIHDIGKIAIPESILNNPGKLSDDEFAVIKQHPELGEWTLRATEYGKHVRDGVLHHHERWDGTGYPHGLSKEDIPLQARIIAVPDVWDAITSERSYRKRLGYEESLQIMKGGRGTQFDPQVLDVFLESLEETGGDSDGMGEH